MKRIPSFTRLLMIGLAALTLLTLSFTLLAPRHAHAESAPTPVSITLPLTVVYQTPAQGTVQLSGVPDTCCTTVNVYNDFTSDVAHVMIGPPNSSGSFSIVTTYSLNQTIDVNVDAYANGGHAHTNFFLVPTANTDILTIPLASLSNNTVQIQATSTNANATLIAYWGPPGSTKKLGKLTNNGNGTWSGQFHINASDGAVTVKSLTHGCATRGVNRPTPSQYC